MNGVKVKGLLWALLVGVALSACAQKVPFGPTEVVEEYTGTELTRVTTTSWDWEFWLGQQRPSDVAQADAVNGIGIEALGIGKIYAGAGGRMSVPGHEEATKYPCMKMDNSVGGLFEGTHADGANTISVCEEERAEEEAEE